MNKLIEETQEQSKALENKILELKNQKADLKAHLDRITDENDVLRKKFAKILDDFQGYIES